MADLVTVVEEIVLAAIVSEKRQTFLKSRTDWALTALSVLFLTVGVIFASIALYNALATTQPAEIAALGTAGAALVLMLIMRMMASYVKRRRRVETDIARTTFGKDITGALNDLLGEIEQPVQDSPKTAMALAALAGFIAANHYRH